LSVTIAYQVLIRKGDAPSEVIVVQAVQELSELVTIRQSMAEVFRSQSNDDTMLAMILKRDKLLMVAHGEVLAGVNLRELKPEDVVVSGKTVSIRLPPARVIDTKLVEQSTYVVDRTTGVLVKFDPSLERQARLYAIAYFRYAAQKEQIEKKASERARVVIEGLLKQLGFASVSVT
jgi:hypothetical protein